MRQYARHRRFVSNISRIVDEEKISLLSCEYLSLYNVVPKEYLDFIVSKIHRINFNEVYPKLSRYLTNQEIHFRLKRVKYLKNEKDITFIFPEKLWNIIMVDEEEGDIMEENRIEIQKEPIEKSEPMESEEKIDKKVERRKITPEMRQWILENVKWSSHGLVHDGKVSASEASKQLGISGHAVRDVIRKFMKENNK